MRLAIVLCFLVGGMVTKIMMIYKVSKAEIYRNIWKGIGAINEAITVEIPLGDLDKLRLLEQESRAKSRSKSWVGELGAVEGFHFRMMNPDRAVPGIAVDRREKRPLFDRDGRPVSALSFDDVLSAGGRRCELNQGARPRGCRVRWGLGLPACASSEYRIC